VNEHALFFPRPCTSSRFSFSLLDKAVGSFGSFHFGRMEEQHHQVEGIGMVDRGTIVEGRDTEEEHLSKRLVVEDTYT
jgi:hypothetical protein